MPDLVIIGDGGEVVDSWPISYEKALEHAESKHTSWYVRHPKREPKIGRLFGYSTWGPVFKPYDENIYFIEKPKGGSR